MGDIPEDLSQILGMPGLFSHLIPDAYKAVLPWLKEHVTDPRMWEEKWDPNHTGETELPTPTPDERASMMARFYSQPDPLKGKEVLTIEV